jgi:hypothetical protein
MLSVQSMRLEEGIANRGGDPMSSHPRSAPLGMPVARLVRGVT